MNDKPLLWMPGDEEIPLSAVEDLVVTRMKREQLRNKNWNFFPGARERQELSEGFAALTRFLHEKEVSNVIFLDRAARPAYIGVKECWKAVYPNEPRPGMLFMNPYGFKSHESMSEEAFRRLKIGSIIFEGKDHLANQQLRHEYDIIAEIKANYPSLLADKDRPIMIFDICIHTGDSLLPVKKALQACGCREVLVGTLNNPPRNHPNLKTDFAFLPESNACKPFGTHSVVKNTFTSVSSLRNTDKAALRASVELRQEIKDLIEEQRLVQKLREA